MGFAFCGFLFFTSAAASQTCNGPGKERWPVKTALLASPSLHPAAKFALNDLLALPEPPNVQHNDPRYQKALLPPFSNSLNVKEGALLTTTGWLYRVATESDDCDYHIQISPVSRTTTNKPTSADNCLVIEVPRPDFVADPQLRQLAANIRAFVRSKLLRGSEPIGAGNVMIHAVCVEATGQLFYDDAHVGSDGVVEARGKRGMDSRTLWELHPLTKFRIVPASNCHF